MHFVRDQKCWCCVYVCNWDRIQSHAVCAFVRIHDTQKNSFFLSVGRFSPIFFWWILCRVSVYECIERLPLLVLLFCLETSRCVEVNIFTIFRSVSFSVRSKYYCFWSFLRTKSRFADATKSYISTSEQELWCCFGETERGGAQERLTAKKRSEEKQKCHIDESTRTYFYCFTFKIPKKKLITNWWPFCQIVNLSVKCPDDRIAANEENHFSIGYALKCMHNVITDASERR